MSNYTYDGPDHGPDYAAEYEEEVEAAMDAIHEVVSDMMDKYGQWVVGDALTEECVLLNKFNLENPDD